MTDFEKYIYNTHLRVSRQAFNKPFKYREDFSILDESIRHILSQLSALFTKHKHIKIDLFFEAPYKIHSTDTPYYLDYYITQKAIKAYSLCISKLKQEDPDTDSQLRFVVESDKFIKKFCQEKSIKTEEYCNYSSGVGFDFIPHLREFNVSVYSLFPFKDFEKNMWSIDIETLKFILGEGYVDNFYVFRNKYLESVKCKTLSELAYKKITTNI